MECTCVVDGVRINYLRAGLGPPMLLLHGLVGSASNWTQNLPALSSIRTVYALDQENMGASGRIYGLDWGLVASADRLARCMDVLGIDRADVAGTSHGGALAMMLASRHPHRVDRLILFAPANPFCKRASGLIRFYNSWAGRVFARQIPRLPKWVHAIAHRRVYGDPRKATPALLDGYTRSLNGPAVEQTLGIVKGWWSDMALLREALPSVARHRTLLIWGDRDAVVGLASGQQLAQALGAELRVIAGAGHLPYAEEPGACNALCLAFLASDPLLDDR